MPVTDDVVAALRAQLKGDRSGYERLFAQMDNKADSARYAALVAAAFTEAAERRFRAEGTPADVIAFVSDVRTRTPGAAEKIDPKIGEQLFNSALMDAPLDDDLTGGTIIATQLLLLAAMIADEDLTSDQLDAFLVESRTLADEWMEATPPRE